MVALGVFAGAASGRRATDRNFRRFTERYAPLRSLRVANAGTERLMAGTRDANCYVQQVVTAASM